ncbi:MAG: ABC transporter substrate-binding protein [Syntrophobacterales bacterium]|nr:ABC transporter substrate-binding protein [Syntrophobacterales bacterium]
MGKSVIFSLIVIFLIGQVAFCGQSIVSIGAINPLTGKLAQHGIEVDQGIRLAIEEANLEEKNLYFNLIRRDDKSLPEDAMNQAQQLITREKVVALVGGYVDTLVGPIATVAGKHRVPYVASASLESRLTETINPFFFRISHINGIAHPIIYFLKEEVKPKRLALVYASTPGAMELSEKIRKGISEGSIFLVLEEKLRPGTPDFSPFLLKCRAYNVDFIVSAMFLPDHLILVKQMKELNVLAKYLGPWGIAYPTFIKEMGERAEGLLGMLAWSPTIFQRDSEEESSRFTKNYSQRFGTEPTSTAMHGYISAKVIIDSVRRVVKSGHPVRSDILADFIRNTDMISPMGRIAFDEKGDPKYYSQTIVQIQKGSFVKVYPIK